MAMQRNRFERHINYKLSVAKTDAEDSKKLRDYLLDSSLDFSGAPLKLLFDAQQIKLAKEFIGLMEKHKYKNADKLRLEARLPIRVLSETDLLRGSGHYTRRGKLVNKLKWKKLWSGLGYPIGVFKTPSTLFDNEFNTAKVYLCTDLTLRCERIRPVFHIGQSYTHGVGGLPAKQLFRKNFKIGHFIESSFDKKERVFQEENLESLLTSLSESALL
jgi:hypothetical protein